MEFWQAEPQMQEKLQGVRTIMEDLIPQGGRFSAIVRPLVKNQGKMLRPALLILSAGLGTKPEEALHLGAALEYLHMASLVHDDIIDQAKERRGQASVVREHGTAIALYTGDYLIFLAAKSLLGLDPSLLSAQATDFMSPLLEAEAEQFETRYRTDLTQVEYLTRIEAKTGLLFSLAATAGSSLGTADEAKIKSMKQAGLDFGAAFQLRDDLADLKDASYGDLREGNYTYPVLLAAAEDAELPFLLKDLQNKAHQDADYEAVVRRILATKAEAKTRELIGRYLKRARAVFSCRMGPMEYRICQHMMSALFGGENED